MNFFEIDFVGKMTTLLKEAFKFKKYKAMKPVFAVFTGIFMLPFVIASFALTISLSVLSFWFTLISSPVKTIHALVHDEGQTVKHATQMIVYLISWPLIFAIYAMMSILVLMIIPTYTLFMFFTYIWSLGGFKFHLFANYEGDIAIEVNGEYNYLPSIFIAVATVVLVLVPFVEGLIFYVDLYKDYLEENFWDLFFATKYLKYVGIHMVFTIFYTLIAFAPRPNGVVVETKETEEIEE